MGLSCFEESIIIKINKSKQALKLNKSKTLQTTPLIIIPNKPKPTKTILQEKLKFFHDLINLP